jgi:hypothetical protein
MIFSLNFFKYLLQFKKDIKDKLILDFFLKIGLEINNIINISDYFNHNFEIIDNKLFLGLKKIKIDNIFLDLLKKNFHLKINNKILILEFKNLEIFKYVKKIINKKNFIEVLFSNDILLDLEFTSNLSYLKNYYNLAFYFCKFTKNYVVLKDKFNLKLQENNNNIKITDKFKFTYDYNSVKNKLYFFSLLSINLKNNISCYNNFYIILGIRYINFIVDFGNFFEKIYGTPVNCYSNIKNFTIKDNLNFDEITRNNSLLKQKYSVDKIKFNKILFSMDEKNNPLCILGISSLSKDKINFLTKRVIIELASFNSSYISFVENLLNLKTSSSYNFKINNNFKIMDLILNKFYYLLSFENVVIDLFVILKKKIKKYIVYKKNDNFLVISNLEFNKLFNLKIKFSDFIVIINKIFPFVKKKINNNKKYDIIVNLSDIFEKHIKNKEDIYQEMFKYLFKNFKEYCNDNFSLNKLNYYKNNYLIDNNNDLLFQKKVFFLKTQLSNYECLEIISDTFTYNKSITLSSYLFDRKNSLRENLKDSFFEYISENNINMNIYNFFYEIGNVFNRNKNSINEQINLLIVVIKKNIFSLLKIFNVLVKVFNNIKFDNNFIYINKLKFKIEEFIVNNNKSPINNKIFFLIEMPLKNILLSLRNNNENMFLMNNLYDSFIDVTFNVLDKQILSLCYYLSNLNINYKMKDLFIKQNDEQRINCITIRFFYSFKTNKEILFIIKDIKNFLKKNN